MVRSRMTRARRGCGSTLYSRADFLCVSFSDSKNGSMTDANGMVWLTGDGGITWLPFNVRTNPRLVSIYLADKFTGWAVGENGLIVRSDDGGYSWQRLTEGGREDVNDLTFFDEDLGVAAGSNGRIWITNDAGRDWIPVFSDTTSNLNAMNFFGDQKGWIVGDNGTVLRTINGGASWGRELPASPKICSASILSARRRIRGRCERDDPADSDRRCVLGSRRIGHAGLARGHKVCQPKNTASSSATRGRSS